MKFFLMFHSPNQNSGAAPVYSIYTVYLCCHLCPPPKFLYVADPMYSAYEYNVVHNVQVHSKYETLVLLAQCKFICMLRKILIC